MNNVTITSVTSTETRLAYTNSLNETGYFEFVDAETLEGIMSCLSILKKERGAAKTEHELANRIFELEDEEMAQSGHQLVAHFAININF